MCAIGRIHETGLEPINCCSLEVGEHKQNLLLIRGEDMGAIAEMQIAGYEEIS